MRKVDPANTAERRRQVLDAALACFRRKGFAASTIAEICAEAGMSPGHLYHYFPSKEDIIGAIAEEDRARASEVCAWLAQQNDLVEAIIGLVSDERADLGSFGIDGALALEIYATAERNPRVRSAVQRNQDTLHAALRTQIQAAQGKGVIDAQLDADATATLIIALFDGLTVAGISASSFNAAAVAETIPFLLGRFLRPGLPPPPAGKPSLRARVGRNVKR